MISKNGLELSRNFYEQIVSPLINHCLPGIPYCVAWIGLGSEVLGYDDMMSTDHDFGPCLQIFLPKSVFPEVSKKMMAVLDDNLPDTFDTFNVHYSDVARPAHGTFEEPGMLGSSHGVEIYTVEAWSQRFLQKDFTTGLTTVEWLSYSEQLFLNVTAGEVFIDGVGDLTDFRSKLSYFPTDVWLFKIASQWGKIAEECAYIGRSSSVGDELGASVIASRMIGNLMRLCMLIERKYAPYPKWFGSAFSKLDCAPELTPLFNKVLTSSDSKQREESMMDACFFIAKMQMSNDIPGAIEPEVVTRRGRPFRFINSLEMCSSIHAFVKDDLLSSVNKIGAVDQFVDSNVILSVPNYSKQAALSVFNASLR